jgi:hypothetical protein
MLGFLGGSKKKQTAPDSVTGMITDNTAPSGNPTAQNNGVTGMITDNSDYSGSAKPYTPATNDSVSGMITDNTNPSGHMDTKLRQVQGVTGMITDNTNPSGHVEHAHTDGVTGMITDNSDPSGHQKHEQTGGVTNMITNNTHPSGHVEHPKIEGVTGMITDNSDPSGRPRLDDLHGAANRGNTGGFGGDGTDVSLAGTQTTPTAASSVATNLTAAQSAAQAQAVATDLTGMGSPEEAAYLQRIQTGQGIGTSGGSTEPAPDVVDRAVANMNKGTTGSEPDVVDRAVANVQGARNLQSGGGNDAGTQATTPAWHANPNWNAANDTTKAAYSDVSGVNSSQILETRQGENGNTLLRMEDGTYKSVNNSGVATDAGTWNNSQWNDSVMGQAAPITLPVQSTDTAPPAGMNAFHLGHGRDLEI